MGNLTAARNTLSRKPDGYQHTLLMSATKIFAGAMVAVDATGYAVRAATTAGLIVVGRADETVDNAAGDAGDKRLLAADGVFRWANDGTVLQAHIGTVVDVSDDNTVKIGAGGVPAGILVELDSDGACWVMSSMALSAALAAAVAAGA